MIDRLEGILSIPHELLHILGYRLVGKRCAYRWGDCRVTLLDPASRTERLIGGLFPFAVSLIGWAIFMTLSGIALTREIHLNAQTPAPFWPIFWGGGAVIAGVYIGACTGDILKAWRTLRKPTPQKAQQQTPEQAQHDKYRRHAPEQTDQR